MHYCCMFNLASVVPVLVGKGCSARRRSAAVVGADTCLHLAARAGHTAVVQTLLQLQLQPQLQVIGDWYQLSNSHR